MKEYSVNDLVMHFREGLVIIKEKTTINNTPYFVLQSLKPGGQSIFVPIDRANSIIRAITSVEQADELLIYMSRVEPEYLTNTKQRRDSFKKKISSGNINDLAYLAMQLHYFNHPEELEKPVKFGPADVEMLKFASKTMFDELAITFNVSRDKVEELVNKKLHSL